jgi:hypothetical protein
MTSAVSSDRVARRPPRGRLKRRLLSDKTKRHPAHIPRGHAGSSRRPPPIPARTVSERPAPGENPRLSPLNPEPPHDRPVTPEVAGSSPVAPAFEVPARAGFRRRRHCTEPPRTERVHAAARPSSNRPLLREGRPWKGICSYCGEPFINPRPDTRRCEDCRRHGRRRREN